MGPLLSFISNQFLLANLVTNLHNIAGPNLQDQNVACQISSPKDPFTTIVCLIMSGFGSPCACNTQTHVYTYVFAHVPPK